MLAIFHDMIKESVEVFMDDFSLFGNSFDKCLNNLDKMLQRCKNAHLVLNWEKSHFMVKEGIVLGHKVSGAGLEVDKAKINTIVHTDHSVLRNLFKKQDAKPRLIRWILLLQEFDIKIKDKKGTQNVAADHLSRIEKDKTSDDSEIDDIFPRETLMEISTKDDPWFADFVNYLNPTSSKYVLTEIKDCVGVTEVLKFLVSLGVGEELWDRDGEVAVIWCKAVDEGIFVFLVDLLWVFGVEGGGIHALCVDWLVGVGEGCGVWWEIGMEGEGVLMVMEDVIDMMWVMIVRKIGWRGSGCRFFMSEGFGLTGDGMWGEDIGCVCVGFFLMVGSWHAVLMLGNGLIGGI
ncbi:hypothetical protein Tco_0763324 [Tanacetum coccineum]